jgi:hypothetical protein
MGACKIRRYRLNLRGRAQGGAANTARTCSAGRFNWQDEELLWISPKRLCFIGWLQRRVWMKRQALNRSLDTKEQLFAKFSNVY